MLFFVLWLVVSFLLALAIGRFASVGSRDDPPDPMP